MPDKDFVFNTLGKYEQLVRKPIKPIKFLTEEQKSKGINPFYVLEDHPNDDSRFAILSSTENGRYVKNGMLVFNYNGLVLYTELNNAIFIDIHNKTIFIKDYHKVQEEITPVNPNERQYIILIRSYEDDDYRYTWEAMTGRNTMYNFIVDNIEERDIDPQNSFILTDNVPFKDALSVANFVRYLKNAELVEEDGFDVEEYIY